MWERALRPVAMASIVANVGIVITGGAVRLTGSGLGCSTWPRCTPESYVVTPELGINGLIEFGKRQIERMLRALEHRGEGDVEGKPLRLQPASRFPCFRNADFGQAGVLPTGE